MNSQFWDKQFVIPLIIDNQYQEKRAIKVNAAEFSLLLVLAIQRVNKSDIAVV